MALLRYDLCQLFIFRGIVCTKKVYTIYFNCYYLYFTCALYNEDAHVTCTCYYLSVPVLHVVQLPGDIGLLSSLTSLDVSHNPLTTLPDELGKCHKMWEVLCTLCLCFFFWKKLTSKCHRVDRCIQ